MVVVDEMKENKTWASLVSYSQSLVSSLLVNLLLSFSSLWHWFQYIYVNLWVVVSEEQENSGLNLTHQEKLKDTTNNIDNSQVKEEEEVLVDSSSSSQKVSDSSNTDTEIKDKMTIEVSAFADAIVNPLEEEDDHSSTTTANAIVHKFSLPITMRLNSEVLEMSSDQDEDLIILEDEEEFNHHHHHERSSQKSGQTDRDSCSGYCSGSGSSLPGSPIPSSNLKELHHLSSDEHEINHHEEEEAVESLDGDDDGLGLDASTTRRDSGSSTASEGTEVSPEVVSRIVSQVESMFSDDHLAKDGFLLKHVRRRSDGFVSLKLVAGLRKVKQISREFPVVLNALKTSESLEVNTEGSKIRRKEPLTLELKAMPIKQAKKEKSGPGDKNQAEKENVNQNLTDEQQLARKRRTGKGDRLNELHFERGSQQQHNSYNRNSSSGRSSFSSTTDDNNASRRRGGSLPITALLQHRGSTAGNYLYPNASPPNAASGFLRPKSNSYSEGTDSSTATMSSWLQKRKASAASTRLSTGEISLAGVIRQPRGPDGTKGFHSGYRTIIVEERLQREMSQQMSSFSA